MRPSPIAFPLALLPAICASAQSVPIVMDAVFDDWRAIAPVFVDPVDAPGAFIDFGEVRAIADGRFVHLLADFGRIVNAQGLDGTAKLLLDADSEPKTGREEHGLAGVDLIVELSPNLAPPTAGVPNTGGPPTPPRTMGVALRSTTWTPPAPPENRQPNDPQPQRLTPYDIGFTFAPTHASRRFEFRIERGTTLPETPGVLAGARFTGKFVFIDLSGAVADETEPFTLDLPPLSAVTAEAGVGAAAADDPLARALDTHLRVMSWNVERGAILSNPQPFARAIAALKPDIILLQELRDTNTADEVAASLDALPRANGDANDARGKWNVILGKGGGDLRCAVASTYPLSSAAALDLVVYPDQPDRTARVAGAIVSAGKHKLLAVSAHLKCCGRAGGPEDETRLIEAQLIHDAVAKLIASGNVSGAIIGGDFNLVGSRAPLELLATGLDLDHSSLAVADAHQLDQLSNATWADVDQPFVPGRLDYMLFTDSSLTAPRAFVFESSDVPAQWRERHRIEATDTDAASDHLPVVADLAWSVSERRPDR